MAAGRLGYEKYRQAIEGYLANLEIGDTPLAAAVKEVLEGGGKRLRPVLSMLVCEAVCGNFERALPAAAAFEMAHSASLVQDDIIDESDTRHGNQATHKKYGAVKAILISDAVIFEIFLEASKYGEAEIPRKKLGQLLGLIGTAAKLTADGEFYEMSLSQQPSVSEQEYLKLAELKTGSLFAGSAASGAIAGGAKKKEVEAAYDFGLNLGVAFQIRDDILDMKGNKYATGKPVLKDIQNNATNLVIVHALSKANSFQRHSIDSMMYRKWFALGDVKKLMGVLEELGSIEHSTAVARQYAERARQRLEELPKSPARVMLEGLAEGLETRSK
jgi:geranylgeranyl pyrophosphate synthase